MAGTAAKIVISQRQQQLTREVRASLLRKNPRPNFSFLQTAETDAIEQDWQEQVNHFVGDKQST